MHDRKLVCMVRYDPIQTPFEHRKRLIDWKRLERSDAIKVEVDLRPEPPPQAAWRGHIDSKINQSVVRTEREIGIQLYNTAIDLRKT